MGLESKSLRTILANIRTDPAPPSSFLATPAFTSDTEDTSPSTVRQRHQRRVLTAANTNTTQQRAQTFISPCLASNNDQQLPLQEATSALLAARAVAKTGDAGDTADGTTNEDYSAFTWDILDTMLSSAGSNGFIPRYRYSTDWNASATMTTATVASTNVSEMYYISGTAYPSPLMFGDAPSSYTAGSVIKNGVPSTIVSGRISSPPFHATAALHSFYLSNQTDVDLWGLRRTFDGLWRYHRFLHEGLLRGCIYDTANNEEGNLNNDGSELNQNDFVPCYNIIHPWESDIEQSSPLWLHAMQPIIDKTKEENWSPSFDLPREVLESFDYPKEDGVYDAMLYLIECHRNATIEFDAEQNQTGSNVGADSFDPYAFEPYLLQRCPFAMLDVGNAAALARADQDLLTMCQILREEDIPHANRPTQLELDAIETWSVQSRMALDSLWDGDRRSYLSHSVIFQRMSPNETNWYTASNETVTLDVPISGNFMAAWGDLTEVADDRATAISYQLLQSHGAYAFNCDEYHIRSAGGCKSTAIIDAATNYWVSYGLMQSEETGLGRYIRNSTLNLVCHLPNVDGTSLTRCPSDVTFPVAYDAQTGTALNRGGCSSTFTASAAVVFNLLVPDKPFEYVAPPPLSSSWVIFLISLELFIALGIGLSCVLLSVNMMRRLSSEDDGDTFVRLLRSQRADASFLYGDSADIAAGDEDVFDETTSAAAAVGLGEELGRLQESPIRVKASSPLRNVQRYLFRGRARDDEG
mmetsp:Transcript_28507/g.62048  ORF Transcript_28507/g.62048 Transcript_28507/m.62048 type:complete len:754 (-) Transcript_28507:45-2306(-)